MKLAKNNYLKFLSVILCIALLLVNALGIPAFGGTNSYQAVDEIGNTVFQVFSPSGYNISNNEKVVKPVLVDNGYENSNAIKLGATTAYKECLVRWQYNDTDRMRFEKGVAYTIEFKVKKFSGTLSNVYAGIFYNYPSNYTYTETYSDSDISDSEWTTLKISTYATNQRG